LEKEEWRYDKFPEFYNGMNVLDFYDPDIEKKLDALEKEEEELMVMEAAEDEIMNKQNEESENSDDVDFAMLKSTLKKVRDKKALIKHAHKMNSKNRVSRKIKNIDDMVDELKAKGHDVDADQIKSRATTRRTLQSLEDAQAKLAENEYSDSEEGSVDDDEEMADAEADKRGRKDRKRTRPAADDDYDICDGRSKSKARSQTPAQRSISAKKIVREKSSGRREGSVPARLPYKLVPDE
jgi:nucleolar GTP-binding protein